MNRNFIYPIVVSVPKPDEQVAIAEALKGVDGLIGSLEAVVLKKRLIKQGAMQELLAGKRRLPGFDTDWISEPLGAIADIRSGGTPSTRDARFWDGGIPWCTPTDITALKGRRYLSRTARTISKIGLASSSAELIPAYSVVMTSRATIGECAINTVPVSTNQGFKNLVPKVGINVDFLFYLIQTQKDALIGLCGGSTFLEINKGQLNNFTVKLPDDEKEQIAIGSVLCEMDVELAALEAKLKKARQLKQGMMQELLTGRVRLV